VERKPDVAAVEEIEAPPAATGYRPNAVQRFPYPVRNVLRRWRGTLGMMLGVGIALGVAMTMLAVSQGSMDFYTLDYKRSGANLYVVTEGGNLIPVLPSDQPGTIEHARGTLARVRGWPEVREAIGVMNWSMEREQDGPRDPNAPKDLLPVVGVDGDPTQIANMADIIAGRWIRRPNEIVVGSRLSRDEGLPLGSTVRLAGQTFTVVGVGKVRGLGAAVVPDGIIYMDYGAFQQRAGIGDVVGVIIIQSSDPAKTAQRLVDAGGLDVETPADLIRKAEQVNQTGVAIYWVMIGLTLVIAALFVSNMLARSVAERRLEFATLRAIGIPRRTILFTVGAEALLISLAAGLIGIALSLVLGALLNTAISAAYALEGIYRAEASLFVLIFVLAILLGPASGLFPARQATRVDPVEVLREA
jgi:ABC-type lipoprotein release transport system permease subunit